MIRLGSEMYRERKHTGGLQMSSLEMLHRFLRFLLKYMKSFLRWPLTRFALCHCYRKEQPLGYHARRKKKKFSPWKCMTFWNYTNKDNSLENICNYTCISGYDDVYC